MEYLYRFVNMGSVASATSADASLRLKRNRFFLDVGNKVLPGAIDHHTHTYNQGARSTASLVLSHPYLVLENLDKSADDLQIEIVVHKDPDFDCLASTYIVQRLIETDGIIDPEEQPYLDSLAAYTNLVDAGRLMLSREKLESPLGISNAIDVVFSQSHPELSGQTFYHGVFQRGLLLIDYVVQRMRQCKVKDPEAPGLFQDAHPFTAEVATLKKDYLLYLQDIEELKMMKNQDFQPFVEMFLPGDQDDSRLEAVSALFWRTVPRCVLHKHWARGDQINDPWGRGFTFTFIPAPVNAQSHKLAQERSLRLSRVIISVKPDSGVNLNGLGAALEKAEQEEQARQFPDNFDAWRNQNDHSKHRSGYNIEDPWYFGEAHNYTIVDAPGRGSLLSLNKIRQVTLECFQPALERAYTRLIIPFQFDNEQYLDLCQSLGQVSTCALHENMIDQGDKEDYFLPYIRKYIFGNNSECDAIQKPKSSWLSYIIRKFSLMSNDGPGRHYCRWFSIEVNASDNGTFENIIITGINLVIFRYGVGFMIVDTHPSDTARIYLFKHILSYNYSLRQKDADIFKYYFPSLPNISISQDPVSHLQVFLAVNGTTLHQAEIPKMMYKLCSIGKWADPFHDSTFINGILEDLILEFQEDALYGFGKAASCFLYIFHPNQNEHVDTLFERFTPTDSRQNDKIGSIMNRFTLSTRVTDNSPLRNIQKFWTVHFVLLLLALQQRKALMKMASDLAAFSNDHIYKRRIPGLRQNFLEFMTQGWFSQISERQIEMEIFHRWQKTFNVAELQEEVTDQLESVDEYGRASLSHTLNVVSLFVFPVMLWSAVLTVLIYVIDIPSRWMGKIDGLSASAVYWLDAGAFIFLLIFVLAFKIWLGRKEKSDL